ncbi:MAG: hypothetical protein JWR68_58 [Polaromonas sp.]|nr:hypothetical protein [Polaromonas sp.]
MVAHTARLPVDAQSLAQAFTAWLRKSTPAGSRAMPAESVFSVNDAMVTLDATRASRLIRNGLDAGSVDELVLLLGLAKKEDLSHALNANSTSLWRWARDNKPLPGQTVEQILRSMQLQLFAADVFGGVEPARTWLQKPHPMLDGLAPSDFADNEFGAQKVRGMLAGLKYGGVA